MAAGIQKTLSADLSGDLVALERLQGNVVAAIKGNDFWPAVTLTTLASLKHMMLIGNHHILVQFEIFVVVQNTLNLIFWEK